MQRGRSLKPLPLHYKTKRMGRGRIGGTRSKIRGAVGAEIYQIRKNAEGKFSQIVQTRPESREYSNTPAQIRARMIMGQIQRMFHIIPDLIKSGFSDVPVGTLSLQHFAKLNAPLLKAQYDSLYSEYGDFDWRPKRDVTAPAGCWILTDGQLPEYNPDGVWTLMYNATDIDFTYNIDVQLSTLGDLLQAMNLERGDRLYCIFFAKHGESYVPSIDINYWEVSNEFDDDFPLIECPDEGFFVYHGNLTQSNSPSLTHAWYDFSLSAQDITPRMIMACIAFIKVHPMTDGSVLFSSSRFRWYDDRPWRFFPMNTPEDVYESWSEQ